MNAKLTGIYADKLAQLRPSIEAVEGAEAAQSAGGAAGAAEGTTAGGSGCGGEEGGQENVGAARDAPLTYSPDPQLLRDKLSEAGTKLPALRWVDGAKVGRHGRGSCSPSKRLGGQPASQQQQQQQARP